MIFLDYLKKWLDVSNYLIYILDSLNQEVNHETDGRRKEPFGPFPGNGKPGCSGRPIGSGGGYGPGAKGTQGGLWSSRPEFV